MSTDHLAALLEIAVSVVTEPKPILSAAAYHPNMVTQTSGFCIRPARLGLSQLANHPLVMSTQSHLYLQRWSWDYLKIIDVVVSSHWQ